MQATVLQGGNGNELRAGARVSTFEAHSGPLPPPGMLAAYDKVVPGLAKQLADALVTESAHRRDLEARELRLSEATVHGDLTNQRLGLKLGFALCFSGLLAATVLAFAGHETTAVVIAGIEFGGLATAFVTRAVKARGASTDKKPEEHGR